MFKNNKIKALGLILIACIVCSLVACTSFSDTPMMRDKTNVSTQNSEESIPNTKIETTKKINNTMTDTNSSSSEGVNELMIAAEIFYINDFSDMDKTEYDTIINSMTDDLINNFSGFGRVGNGFAYLMLSRIGDADIPIDHLDISIKKPIDNTYYEAYYLSASDTILLIIRPENEYPETNLAIEGMHKYLQGVSGESNLTLDDLVEMKANGVAIQKMDSKYFRVSDMSKVPQYIVDFDFDSFYNMVSKQEGTKQKAPENCINVGILLYDKETGSIINLALTPNGEKVVNNYLDEELFDNVANIAMEKTDWNYLLKTDIQGVQSAELIIDGESYGTLTDAKKLVELESLIQNSEPTEDDHLCNYIADLVLQLKNGKTVRMALDADDDYITIGAGSIYDYGPTFEQNNSNALYQLFGINDIQAIYTPIMDARSQLHEEHNGEINLIIGKQ